MGSASLQLHRKLVIIGDSACGKTSLLTAFTLGYFSTIGFNYWNKTTSNFETFIADCRVDDKAVQLALYDTPGQQNYERLQPLVYLKPHVILVGFSIDNPESLDNVRHKWAEEASRLGSGAPIILVGLKEDLRDDSAAIEEMRKKPLPFVARHEGELVALEIGASRYMECSSLSSEGVDNVFEAATRVALSKSERGVGGYCAIL